MCPHDEFKVLYYKFGVLIRRCLHCNGIEISTEYWVEPGVIRGAMNAAGV